MRELTGQVALEADQKPTARRPGPPAPASAPHPAQSGRVASVALAPAPEAPVGNAAHDPLMILATDIIGLSMRGEPGLAWAQVSQLHPGRQAAVLSILVAFLNYRFAGLDPLVLAAME